MFSSITTPDFVALYARSYPSKAALTDLSTNEVWTYEKFDREICQTAALLKKKGCQSGDRVALLARNDVLQIIIHFACARLGLIYTPFNWRLSTAELDELIDRSRPKLILCDNASSQSLSKQHSFEIIKEFLAEARNLKAETAFSYDPDRTSLMLFTSGTSGMPKGVMLTERNLTQSATNFGALTAVNQHSCFLSEAPLFHVMAMVANIRTVLQHGGHIYLSDGYQAERTLRWLADDALGITHYTGVPQMIERFRTLEGFDPNPLRRVTLVTGGAPHPHKDIEAWTADGVTLVSGFGMTEVGTALGMPLDKAMIVKKMGSVGLLPPGMQARLVDNNGNDVTSGESGELWLQGDGITKGYWEDEVKTKEAFAEGRWFKTGDIVKVDEDGYYWIVDRKKDMFISGGENVYPAEIENLTLSYPNIEEVAVVGVPDEKWGEVGCLVAVMKPDCAFSPAELETYLRTKLAPFKVPKHFIQMDSLPRTKSTGKLQKNELKAIAIKQLDNSCSGSNPN